MCSSSVFIYDGEVDKSIRDYRNTIKEIEKNKFKYAILKDTDSLVNNKILNNTSISWLYRFLMSQGSEVKLVGSNSYLLGCWKSLEEDNIGSRN